jgi:succinoglycan biosynthesis transport protein ExoP
METTRKTRHDNAAEQPRLIDYHDYAAEEINLVDYYYVLRKRAWLIFSLLFLTGLVTTLLTFSQEPIYEATASLAIDEETQRSPLTGEPLYYGSYASHQLTKQTHAKLITSRPVLERIIAQGLLPTQEVDQSSHMGLFSRFSTTVKSNVKRFINTVFRKDQEEEVISPEERLITAKIARLRDKVEIEGVRDTRLLNIHVEDQDPRAARDIANTVAQTYILYDSDTRLENSRTVLDWLSSQVYTMKKKVEDAEKAFQAFKERENLFSISGKQKINVQKIEEMNAAYIDARTQRLVVEAKIDALKKFIFDNEEAKIRNIPAFLKNELLENLYVQLLNAEIDYREISKVYKHKHPEMLKVTSKISELERKIRQQIQKALENAARERQVLVAREKALQDAASSYEGEAITTNRKELDYAILEREMQTNRELYNTLLSKMKEADINEGIARTNLRLVEPAALPVSPIKPKKLLTLMLSMVVGLFAGVFLAFFLEYLDRTFHNKEEVEKALDLPVLSEIPLQGKKYLKKNKPGGYSAPIALDHPMTSQFSEAFRILVTNLKFAGFDQAKGVYLVSSSDPMEGKTTVCCNLGLTMAKFGLKTLIVDADLRMPTVKKLFGVTADKGLSDILSDTFGINIGSGTLDELTVGDIHKIMEIQEKSGVVYYENETNVFKVSFDNGQMIDVDWPTRPAHKRLGSLLMQSGKLSKEQLEIAVSKWKDTSLRFGQILLHLGFLSAEELAGPLKLQRQENIQELSRCEHARFHFQENPVPISPALDPREVALRNAMGRLDVICCKGTPFLLDQIQQRLIHVSDDNNLWVLPSGKIPPNPAEFLSRKRMKILIDLLRDQFDLILLDSAPVALASDAAVLAPRCDGVILVMRAGVTQADAVRRAKEQLEATETPIMGAVLNMIDFKKDPYYRSRCSYKYGDYHSRQECKAKDSNPGSALSSG